MARNKLDGLAVMAMVDLTPEMFRNLKLLALNAKLYMQKRDAASFQALDKMVDQVYETLDKMPAPPIPLAPGKKRGRGRPRTRKV